MSLSREHILKKDFMIKRSVRKSKVKFDNYKNRWFVLCPQALYYCDGTLETGPGKTVKGGIILSSIIVVENTEPEYIGGRLFCFQIVYQPVTDDPEEIAILYIKASHDEQRRSWVEQLRATCMDVEGFNPAERYHPVPYQSGRYSCCEIIDRRADGCLSTSWPQVAPLTRSRSTGSTSEETKECGVDKCRTSSESGSAVPKTNSWTREKNTPVPQPPIESTVGLKNASFPPVFDEPTESRANFTSLIRQEIPLPALPKKEPRTPLPRTDLPRKFEDRPLPQPSSNTSIRSGISGRTGLNGSMEKNGESRFNSKPIPAPRPSKKAKLYLATSNFKPQQPGDLNLTRGDEYEILDETDPNWWTVKCLTDGRTGCAPSNHLVPVTQNIDNGEELLRKYNWYLGDIERIAAEELLTDENKVGAFLVRKSERSQQDKKHSHTLSLFATTCIDGKSQNSVRHYKILRNAELKYYITESHDFTCIADLVAYHRKHASGLLTKLVSAPTKALDQSAQDDGYYTIVPPPYARPKHM